MHVVITGASKGIGKAIALAFAAEGATLFLCARSKEPLEAAAVTIKKEHPSCTVNTMVADMADKEAAAAFGKWCLQAGVPDIVVNNAGHFLAGDIRDEYEGNLERMIAVNLYSAYYFTRALLPAMTNGSSGKARHIFNICSVASLQAYPGGGAYSISKFALHGFSKNLREELKEHNIKVTSVFPGAVLTDSWAGFDNSSNRIMEADDIAKMILAASKLSKQATVEDIVIRPQLGDL